MDKIVKEIDWNTYEDIFPERYMRNNLLDEMVQNFIHNNKEINAVDIGGGSGTKALNNHKVKVWLLDSFCTAKSWMQGNVSWNTTMKFDIAIARNCINYLSEEQIKKANSMSRYFIANTFEHPPNTSWTERTYTSKNNTGIERFKYNKKSQIIQHQLIQSNCIINHEFKYYSVEYLRFLMPKLTITRYNKNSILIQVHN